MLQNIYLSIVTDIVFVVNFSLYHIEFGFHRVNLIPGHQFQILNSVFIVFKVLIVFVNHGLNYVLIILAYLIDEEKHFLIGFIKKVHYF